MPLFEETSSTPSGTGRLIRIYSCLDDLWGYYLEEHPTKTQSSTTMKEFMDWSYRQTLCAGMVKIPPPATSPDAPQERNAP